MTNFVRFASTGVFDYGPACYAGIAFRRVRGFYFVLWGFGLVPFASVSFVAFDVFVSVTKLAQVSFDHF
jgi:hypothetical protein